jgi:hypothetical protein
LAARRELARKAEPVKIEGVQEVGAFVLGYQLPHEGQ